MALQELVERGHDIRIVSFGGADVVPMPIPHEHLGVRSPRELAATYAQAISEAIDTRTRWRGEYEAAKKRAGPPAFALASSFGSSAPQGAVE